MRIHLALEIFLLGFLASTDVTVATTTEEVMVVFDQTIIVEGLGFNVQRVDGQLPDGVQDRVSFARERVWCVIGDDDETCEIEFKKALHLYGNAIEMPDGSMLCSGMSRQDCMTEGRSQGYFPGPTLVSISKAEELIDEELSLYVSQMARNGREIRKTRHGKTRDRKP